MRSLGEDGQSRSCTVELYPKGFTPKINSRSRKKVAEEPKAPGQDKPSSSG